MGCAPRVKAFARIRLKVARFDRNLPNSSNLHDLSRLKGILARAKEYHDLKRAARENRTLRLLVDSGTELSSSKDLRQVCDLIASATQSAGFDRVRVCLLSDDRLFVLAYGQRRMGEQFIGSEWLVSENRYFDTLLKEPVPRICSRQGIEGFPYGGRTETNDSVREWLSIPLMWNGKVIGEISADNKFTRRAINYADIELLSRLGQLASGTVQNVKRDAEINQRADQLETLRRITFTITEQRDRQSLLLEIIRQAVELLDAKNGGVYEYYPEHGELRLIADLRYSAQVGTILHEGEGMAGSLVLSNDPYMFINNYKTWPGRALQYADSDTFGAVLEVPLRWHDRILGVLYIDDSLGRRFTPDDAHLLGLFADEAAVALANLNLQDDNSRRQKRIERLADVTKELVRDLGETSLDERLQLIAKYAQELLEAETCGIFLVSRPGWLSLEASCGHRSGGFDKGRAVAILDGARNGLTGYIAFHGKLFNDHGDTLRDHTAVRDKKDSHTPSGQCYSLLAIPLHRKGNHKEELVGLLRVDNKKNSDGHPLPTIGFTRQDEVIIRIFADAVAVALEAAQLVQQLSEQKKRLVGLLDKSSGVLALDRKGLITEVSKQSEEILGYQKDELIGKHFSVLLSDQSESLRVIRHMIATEKGTVRSEERLLRHKQGYIIPVRFSATWQFDSKHRRIGSIACIQDLRPVRRLERENELLQEASDAFLRASDTKDGFRELATMILQLLDNTFCRIVLLENDVLRVKASAMYSKVESLRDWQAQGGDKTRLSDWPHLEAILRQGIQILSVKVQRDRPFLEELTRSLDLEPGIKSLLVIPLKLEGERLLGYIEVGDVFSDERTVFTPEEISVASDIAAQTKVHIGRIQLYESIERRRNELELLHDAARRISGARTLAETKTVITQTAKQVFRAISSAIWFYDNQQSCFVPEQFQADGIPQTVFDEFKRAVPQQGDTAFQVLAKGWFAIEDLAESASSVDAETRGPAPPGFSQKLSSDPP